MGIFLKEPVPGRVKTRLAARLGDEAAASLYTALLGDTVTLAERSRAKRVILIHDGRVPAEFDGRFARIEQPGGDLGARLDAAARDAEDREFCPVVLLGSDSPDLPVEQLDAAGSSLAGHELCLGATADGGVWCIGLRRPCPGLFEDLPWSDPRTGAALRNRADDLGLKRAELTPWFDVDEIDDLVALAARLDDVPGRAPRTRRWLLEHDGPWRAPHGGHS